MSIKIYGHSDDAIVVIGNDFKEQFDCYEGNEVIRFLAFSDGTLLRITYGLNDEACWRITQLRAGTAMYSLVQVAPGNEEGAYSDAATLSESNPIQWVICSKAPPAFRRSPPKPSPSPL